LGFLFFLPKILPLGPKNGGYDVFSQNKKMQTKSKVRERELERIDAEIRNGHRLVHLMVIQATIQDDKSKNEISAEIRLLLSGSRYISEVVNEHPDPLSFLASRCQRNDRSCQLVFDGGLPVHKSPKCPTASGERLHELVKSKKSYAANWGSRLGSAVHIRGIETGRSASVVVRDRGPAKRLKSRIIDLDRDTFIYLCGSAERGLCKVEVTE
jgi:hypothetical protein